MLSILDVINSTKLLTNFGVTCGEELLAQVSGQL